jgi:hypothetical protein
LNKAIDEAFALRQCLSAMPIKKGRSFDQPRSVISESEANIQEIRGDNLKIQINAFWRVF